MPSATSAPALHLPPRALRLGLALCLSPLLAAAEPAVTSDPLILDNEALTLTGSLSGRLMPRSGLEIPLQPGKPAEIRREPAYRGTPLYAQVRFGDGPRAATWVAVDRAPDSRREENRLYVDRNQNGDLTDDGDGTLQSVGKNLPGARVGPHFDTARASWGDAQRETSSGEYGFMCLIGAERDSPQQMLLLRTAAVRTGMITLAGRARRIALMETRADGIFDISQAVPADPRNFATRGLRTMTLLLDVDGDGEFGAREVFDACLPLAAAGVTYRASAPPAGSRVTLTPTNEPAQEVKVPVRTAAKNSGVLAPGTPAPDFTVDKFGGGTTRLSDFRGRTVVLDFWATWCIPCIRAMPHVQKAIAKSGRDDVVWLGVCVWDDRASFDRWVPANDTRYPFVKVFDPAAKDRATSIASRLYRVTGIPTLYVIGPDGRIVEGMVGYLGDDDHRLSSALARLAPR